MALLAAASAFVMTSCGDDKDDDPKPESFDVPKESKYTETAEGVYVTYPYPDAENPVCSYTIGYKFEGDKVTEYTYVIVCADAVTAKAVKDSWDTSKISNIKQDGNTVTVYYPLQENISKELAIVGIRALGKVNGVEVPADALRKEKGIKSIRIENKLYDMIIYRENTEEFTDKPLELGKLLDKG